MTLTTKPSDLVMAYVRHARRFGLHDVQDTAAQDPCMTDRDCEHLAIILRSLPWDRNGRLVKAAA